jgi:hypothetical protein
VARTYFESGDDELLREAFVTINEKWPQPENLPAGTALEIFGKHYEVTDSLTTDEDREGCVV